MFLYVHQDKRPIFFPVSMLGEKWKENEFIEKLTYYLKKLNIGEGKIFFNPDLSPSEKMEDHYFTTKPPLWYSIKK
jgi:hypothetical protein